MAVTAFAKPRSDDPVVKPKPRGSGKSRVVKVEQSVQVSVLNSALPVAEVPIEDDAPEFKTKLKKTRRDSAGFGRVLYISRYWI
jgi:hypothetical protein